MNEKVNAIMWFCGCSKTEAQKVIKNSDVSWVNEIVKCFKDNARRNFYED